MSQSSIDYNDPRQLARLLGNMNFKGYDKEDDLDSDDEGGGGYGGLAHMGHSFHGGGGEYGGGEYGGGTAGGNFLGNYVRNAPIFHNEPAPHSPRASEQEQRPAMQAQLLDDDDDMALPELGGANKNFFNLIGEDIRRNPMRGDVAASGEVDDDGNPVPRSSPKRSFGSKVKGFFKGAGRMAQGLWGLGKNITGYNLIRHGLFGANFRRGKLNKNLAKWNALGKTNEERFQARGVWEIQRKIARNRLMLANHRHYYSGLKMANEFRRGAGKELIRETQDSPLPKFFHGY